MDSRKDAFFATNNLVAELRGKLSELDNELVYTIGRVEVFPNTSTVIPNKVVFSLEARHKSPAVITQVEEIIQGLTRSNANEGCEINVTKLWDRDTVF